MEPKHFYFIGWLLVAALFGVLAVTLTWLFVLGAFACFALGASVERELVGVRHGRVSWRRLSDRLPVEIRSPIVRKPSVPKSAPPLGLLDFNRVSRRAIGKMTVTVNQMSKDLVAMNSETTKSTARMDKVANQSNDVQIRETKRFARKLDEFADRLESREETLRKHGDPMTRNYLNRLAALPADAAAVLAVERDDLSSLRENMIAACASTSGYRDAVARLRAMFGGFGVEQSLNETIERLLRALDRLLEDYAGIVEFTNQGVTTINAKLPPVPPVVELPASRAQRRARVRRSN
jgi:hypothetical protein